MDLLRQAAQQALEAWDRSRQWPFPTRPDKEFDALRAALAQPEPEPVAFFTWRDMVTFARNMTEEIKTIINDNTDGDGICCADDLLAAIQAHGIGGEHE